MNAYELNVLYKIMPKDQLFAAIKRTANSIFQTGGFLRNIENYGEKPLPYKMTAHKQLNKRGHYFLIEFSAPIPSLATVHDEIGRDIDVIRRNIIKQITPTPFDCTLEEELLPAPYRPDVQKLMKTKFTRGLRFSKEFDAKSGFDFYPFQ